MERRVVHTDKVAPARVPRSQAIKVGEWVFASGQLGTDPKTGRLVEGGITAETRQVCENLKAVLEAAGSSLGKVVKVARTTFQAAGLVAGARVEIEAIATV